MEIVKVLLSDEHYLTTFGILECNFFTQISRKITGFLTGISSPKIRNSRIFLTFLTTTFSLRLAWVIDWNTWETACWRICWARSVCWWWMQVWILSTKILYFTLRYICKGRTRKSWFKNWWTASKRKTFPIFIYCRRSFFCWNPNQYFF
jgi:hypothetical protein